MLLKLKKKIDYYSLHTSEFSLSRKSVNWLYMLVAESDTQSMVPQCSVVISVLFDSYFAVTPRYLQPAVMSHRITLK